MCPVLAKTLYHNGSLAHTSLTHGEFPEFEASHGLGGKVINSDLCCNAEHWCALDEGGVSRFRFKGSGFSLNFRCFAMEERADFSTITVQPLTSAQSADAVSARQDTVELEATSPEKNSESAQENLTRSLLFWEQSLKRKKPSSWKVQELKMLLQLRGFDTKGRKAELQER